MYFISINPYLHITIYPFMKRILFFFLFFCAYCCTAQNYKCVQNGVKHYFTNSKGYLRGISIDSVRTSGTDTIYFPFKTFRKYLTIFAPSQGSWLGSKIVQKNDGVFQFNTIWRDTIFIKTQAAPGDSWVFYNDSTSRSYRATVLAVDTMTFLGITDSVKKIKLSAYVGSAPHTTNPINDFEIVLSKNHGFVTIFDLHMFPYTAPGAAYDPGIDVYLFETTTYSIHPSDFIFTLSDYHPPTKQEMHNLNVGDVFIRRENVDNSTGSDSHSMIYDSVISKTIVDTFHTIYNIFSASNTSYVPDGPGAITHHSSTYIMPVTADTSLLIPIPIMPEHIDNSHIAWYYIPDDSSNCIVSPYYGMNNIIDFEGCTVSRKYKSGFDELYYEQPGYSMELWCYQTKRTLLFSIINGVPCGIRPPFSVGVNEVKKSSDYTIFPNPVQDILNVISPEKVHSVSIYNSIGQIVINQKYATTTVSVNVAHLPPGMYFARINDSLRIKFVKQ